MDGFDDYNMIVRCARHCCVIINLRRGEGVKDKYSGQ